jgi:hypothetical protein
MDKSNNDDIYKKQNLQCKYCNESKPCSDFYKRNIERGYQYFCKECYISDINIPFQCICGKNIKHKNNYARHIKTKLHGKRVRGTLIKET